MTDSYRFGKLFLPSSMCRLFSVDTPDLYMSSKEMKMIGLQGSVGWDIFFPIICVSTET